MAKFLIENSKKKMPDRAGRLADSDLPREAAAGVHLHPFFRRMYLEPPKKAARKMEKARITALDTGPPAAGSVDGTRTCLVKSRDLPC